MIWMCKCHDLHLTTWHGFLYTYVRIVNTQVLRCHFLWLFPSWQKFTYNGSQALDRSMLKGSRTSISWRIYFGPKDILEEARLWSNNNLQLDNSLGYYKLCTAHGNPLAKGFLGYKEHWLMVNTSDRYSNTSETTVISPAQEDRKIIYDSTIALIT